METPIYKTVDTIVFPLEFMEYLPLPLANELVGKGKFSKFLDIFSNVHKAVKTRLFEFYFI
jgi:hypothetical protein